MASSQAVRQEAAAKGLYRPDAEHDACGVGFVANIKGHVSHKIIEDALLILHNLDHRGAVGADPLDRKSTRLNSSHKHRSRMPSSA